MTFGMRFRCESRCEQGFASDTGGWSRNFAYDSYDNMWVSGSSGIPLAGNTPTSNVYSAANQISGSSYDASGNQLAVNGDITAYDAENHLTTVTEPPSMGGGTETLVYDGSGQRVQKILPSGTTNYVYDAFGRLIAEYTTNPTESPCWTCYLTYDHLASVRMVTSGNLQFVVRHDFLPFGEELSPNSAGRNGQWGPGTDNLTQKFTGQIRDEETDLDYFKARYFGAALGRFTSPDPQNAGADPTNPQSWNGYSYVANNPLANMDPSGMTNYAGIQQGFCPASQANCPMPGQPTVGTPTVPNEIDAAEAAYSSNVNAQFYTTLGIKYANQQGIGSAINLLHLAGYQVSDVATTFAGQTSHTITIYDNVSLVAAPQDGNGNPIPPPVALPPGKNGQPNVWVPTVGSGSRDKWKPFVPVPNPKGAQPQASWDPQNGHWDVDWGNKVRERYLPNGTKVDHFNNPIPFAAAGAGVAGVAVGFSLPSVLEWLGLGALAF